MHDAIGNINNESSDDKSSRTRSGVALAPSHNCSPSIAQIECVAFLHLSSAVVCAPRGGIPHRRCEPR
eukprot:480126-Rhodomonas_salina.1